MVNIYGLVPFQESIKKQKESTVLLFLEWNDPRAKVILTSKIYEYLGANRSILGISYRDKSYRDKEIDVILVNSGCGLIVNEINEIKEILLKWIDEFKEHGDVQSYYNPNHVIIKQYNKKDQAKKLARAFDKIIDITKINKG